MSNKLSPSFIVKKIEKDIAEIINFFSLKLNLKPKLVVLLIGDKKESQIYVDRKIKKAQETGFNIELIKLPELETQKSLLTDVIENLNKDESVNAILIQLPLPEHLKSHTLEILNKISPEKDIDGLTSWNSGLLNTINEVNYDHDIIGNILKFIKNNKEINLDTIGQNKTANSLNLEDFNTQQDLEHFSKNFLYSYQNYSNLRNFLINFGYSNPIIPCTPLGVFYIIKRFFKDQSLEGKTAVVFGDSNLVGKPISRLLLKNKITTTICNSKTQNGEFFSRNADIIVLATGKRNFFDEKFFNKDKIQIVCDVGISAIENNKITGDLCNSVKQNEDFKNLYYTPVPFGVGQATINSIMLNMLLIFISSLFKKNKL